MILGIAMSPMRVRQTCNDSTVSTMDPMKLRTERQAELVQDVAPRKVALSESRCREFYTGTDDEQGGAQV